MKILENIYIYIYILEKNIRNNIVCDMAYELYM